MTNNSAPPASALANGVSLVFPPALYLKTFLPSQSGGRKLGYPGQKIGRKVPALATTSGGVRKKLKICVYLLGNPDWYTTADKMESK